MFRLGVGVRSLKEVVTQEFSEALAVEGGFRAAVPADLLWPCSVCDVTVGTCTGTTCVDGAGGK